MCSRSAILKFLVKYVEKDIQLTVMIKPGSFVFCILYVTTTRRCIAACLKLCGLRRLIGPSHPASRRPWHPQGVTRAVDSAATDVCAAAASPSHSLGSALVWSPRFSDGRRTGPESRTTEDISQKVEQVSQVTVMGDGVGHEVRTRKRRKSKSCSTLQKLKRNAPVK